MINYTFWMIEKYWIEQVESRQIENKKVHKSPDIWYLMWRYEHYKALLSQLKKV
jgi:hypothetical protein